MKILSILLLLFLTCNSTSAYYHKFIAENSVTRKFRGVLNFVLNANPNPNKIDRWTGNYGSNRPRAFSHALFVGTPEFISQRVAARNKAAIEAKAKMIEKKKTQKKIDKELKKQPFAYSTVTIPDWDKSKNVSMFVISLSRGGMFKGKKTSSKVPVDFNIVDADGNVVCNSSEPLKAIKLTENDMKYVPTVYLLDRFLGDDTIYIKYYDPKCLVSYSAETIAIEYKTKKGKPIHNNLEMDFFKSAIKEDFKL